MTQERFAGVDVAPLLKHCEKSKPVLDKASEGLMNYLSVTNNGTNTSITIDRDGTASTFAPTLILTLNNVATETLLVNHQLIV
ncbi:type I secretion C-terminal target domain-containing protein [Microcoleus sp. A2-C2]|uniref:type I secretion C-terminal target domain-containing protein n=1 Tax=Microcoleus sp. A2-C2 TaxID=2818530 RepID=UPI002FCF1C7D